MYSALAVDRATVCCFFELQATAPPAIIVTYPEIDFRSGPFPQSASQKKLSSVLLILVSFPPYVNFAFLVCFEVSENPLYSCPVHGFRVRGKLCKSIY